MRWRCARELGLRQNKGQSALLSGGLCRGSTQPRIFRIFPASNFQPRTNVGNSCHQEQPEAAAASPSHLPPLRENVIVTVLPTVAVGAVGVWRCLQGDNAGFIFLGLAAVFIGLAVFAAIHRRRVAPEGPPDPSAAWRLAGHADQRVHAFTYSRGGIWTARAFGALSLLAGPAIYLASSPRPAGTDLWWLAAFVLVFNGAFLLMVLACERYRVEVGPDGIVHYRLRPPLRHAFAALGSLALLEGSGRGPAYVLALYDRQGRCVDTFGDTLEGFTELTALAKEYAFAAGLTFRYRDMWGAWTG